MKANNETKKRDSFKFNLIEGAELKGYYGLPMLKATQVGENITMIPFNYIFSVKNPNRCYIHFYLDDYQFERIWNEPKLYTEILKSFKGVVAPDFSLFLDMPKAYQIWNCYRSRVLAYFWQRNGIKVIPNVVWSDEDSYNWCFDGLPTHSTIAVSSIGCMKSHQTILNFCKGFQEMDKRLQPTKILFYGKIPESLKDDTRIVHVETFVQLRFDKEKEFE